MNKLNENEIKMLTELEEKATEVYAYLGRTYWIGFTDDGKDKRTDVFTLQDHLIKLVQWFDNQCPKSLNSIYSKVETPNTFGSILKLEVLSGSLLEDLNAVLHNPAKNVPLYQIYNLVMAVSRWNSAMDLGARNQLDKALKQQELEHA